MNVFPTPIPQIEILIHRMDGSIEIEQVHTKLEALAFCKEEVKLESTKRVICDMIEFDMTGSFLV